MSRRDRKPMDHQVVNVRVEMLATVGRLVDDWPWIDSLAGHLRAASGGESSGGGHADPTALAAAAGDAAGDWLVEFSELRAMVRRLDGRRAALAPSLPKRGRVNTVEVCSLCSLPAPKVKRIDGQPYCASSCYYRAWRAGRPA